MRFSMLRQRGPASVALLLASVLVLSACVAKTPPATATRAATSAAATARPSAVASLATVAPTPTAAVLPVRPVSTPSVTPAAAFSEPVSPEPQLGVLSLSLAPAAEGLSEPLFVTHAGDGSGRIFIVEKRGTIRVHVEGRLLERPFLDIRDRVGSGSSEQGLLGLAFAPDYSRSGRFFVNYTNRKGDTAVSRFLVTGEPNLADPDSEFLVIEIGQPAENHNGGMLLFGPDGYLWIGTGDGGAANDRFGNGQNPDTLLGKILRLDVTTESQQAYLIPKDNPWLSADWNGVNVRDEVWAVGLRNPWRYSFDRATGDLWIADVGQNRYEEVDYIPADTPGGLNFGWPIMEGTHCFPEEAACQRAGLEIPVVEYSHGVDGCSVTGGYVYRGAQFPTLTGVYLYGDYCSGKIWGLARTGNDWRNVELLISGLNISSFGEDEAGELYVTDLRGGVYRIVVE